MPPDMFKPLIDKAITMIWQIVAIMFFATTVRIAVMTYMKQRGFHRATIDFASYIAFGVALYGGYLIWTKYLI